MFRSLPFLCLPIYLSLVHKEGFLRTHRQCSSGVKEIPFLACSVIPSTFQWCDTPTQLHHFQLTDNPLQVRDGSLGTLQDNRRVEGFSEAFRRLFDSDYSKVGGGLRTVCAINDRLAAGVPVLPSQISLHLCGGGSRRRFATGEKLQRGGAGRP